MTRTTATRLTGGTLAWLALTGAAWAQSPGASVPGGWWHTLALAVVNPWLTIALLLAGCVLLFVDLLTPKTWEWTGSTGVCLVAVVFAAHVAERTGGWVGIVLMLAGVGGLLLETHVFPGRAVAAIGGLLALFLGMFTALGGAAHMVFALPIASVLTVVTLIAFFAYLPKSPLWKEISQQMRGDAGSGARSFGTNELAVSPMRLLGETGVTLSALRPSGVARFGGATIDVVTEGDFLEPNQAVLVTQVENGRVVVEPVAVPNRDVIAAL